ncbi:MAG: peptidase M14, partial [Gammaproteobacteria bacterium]|nr:peptidase M14 [Gammaproteobacteria bacterium]
EAAAAGVRTLPDQADFNRIWRPASGIAAEVLATIGDEPLMAVVDLHNNTGKNPAYAVLTDLSPGSLGLARLHGGVGVIVEEPDTVLTRAFAGRAPSIALELGPVGDPEATGRAARYLDGLLSLPEAPTARIEDLRLYRTLARVHPPADATFGFSTAGQGKLDLVLNGGIEENNFRPLPAGTEFGQARNGFNLQVLDNRHRDVTSQFLDVRDGRILATRTLMPAMYTTDASVVRQDCLCYLMAPAVDGGQSGQNEFTFATP